MAWGKINLTAVGSGISVFSASSVESLPSGSIGDIGIITTQQIGNISIGNETIPSPQNNDVVIETTQMNNACPVTVRAGAYPFTVYPSRCSQYNGSVWVFREFYVKNGSGWTSPYAYLYYSGQEFPEFSGGWQVRGWRAETGMGLPSTASLTKNTDHMLLNIGGVNYSAGVAEVVSNIDLTNYSAITAVINNTAINGNTTGAIRLVAVSRSATYWWTGSGAGVAFNDTLNVDQTKSIDVSALNGSYDVLVGVYNAAVAGCRTKIKDVRLIS